MLFPRFLAFAERAWHKASWEDMTDVAQRTKEQQKDWERFAAIVGQGELERLERKGVEYRLDPPGARYGSLKKVVHVWLSISDCYIICVCEIGHCLFYQWCNTNKIPTVSLYMLHTSWLVCIFVILMLRGWVIGLKMLSSCKNTTYFNIIGTSHTIPQQFCYVYYVVPCYCRFNTRRQVHLVVLKKLSLLKYQALLVISVHCYSSSSSRFQK